MGAKFVSLVRFGKSCSKCKVGGKAELQCMEKHACHLAWRPCRGLRRWSSDIHLHNNSCNCSVEVRGIASVGLLVLSVLAGRDLRQHFMSRRFRASAHSDEIHWYASG